LEVVVAAMVDVGWDAAGAPQLVRLLAQTPTRHADRAKGKEGWRLIAADLVLPPLQVRRTMVLLPRRERAIIGRTPSRVE
jgi:hypothetical protein